MLLDSIRIFIYVLLLVSFLIFFGQKNIQRFQDGGIAIVRNEKEIKAKNIPNPGETFSPLVFHF